MAFADRRARGVSLGFALIFLLVFCAGIVAWALLGELNVLGLDYVHAQGGSTGSCYDTTTGIAVPTECAEGTQVALYPSSVVRWQMGVTVGALLAWGLILPLLLRLLKLAHERLLPFSFASAMAVAAIALTGAFPDAQNGWIIFARVVVIVAAALLGFFMTNFVAARMMLAAKNREDNLARVKQELLAEEQRRAERDKIKGDARKNEREYVDLSEIKSGRVGQKGRQKRRGKD